MSTVRNEESKERNCNECLQDRMVITTTTTTTRPDGWKPRVRVFEIRFCDYEGSSKSSWGPPNTSKIMRLLIGLANIFLSRLADLQCCQWNLNALKKFHVILEHLCFNGLISTKFLDYHQLSLPLRLGKYA